MERVKCFSPKESRAGLTLSSNTFSICFLLLRFEFMIAPSVCRLDDLDSTLLVNSLKSGMKKNPINLQGLSLFKGRGMNRFGVITFGESLRTGVSRAVHLDDL